MQKSIKLHGVTHNVYTFNLLSDEAKEAAICGYRDKFADEPLFWADEYISEYMEINQWLFFKDGEQYQ